jgi:hypothetical protein
VDIDARAALDQPGRLFRIGVVEHAEAARPPIAAHVDVGAELEQRVDHEAVVLRRHDRLGAEMKQRPIDERPQGRRRRQERPHPRCVLRFHRGHEVADLRQGSARNEVGAHAVRVVVEHTDGAAPELAAAVDVGAEVEQRIDHRSIVPAEDDGGGGVEGGTVDRGAQFGLPRQQSPNRRRVACSDGFLERLHPPFILVPGARRARADQNS